jgi:hypothetical protein
MRSITSCICLSALLASLTVMAYEEPAFTPVALIDGIEYRHYHSYLVAETIVTDDVNRDKAANIAFRRLFDYISGENSVSSKMAMTTPVRQEALSRKIDMTTPVRQEIRPGGWAVSFVVPRAFTLETAPRPTNPDVYLRRVPGERVAVLRYSGRWTNLNIDSHRTALLSGLAAAGIRPTGEVVTAFYNAPFSLPPLRRNEVMVAVAEFPREGG